LKAGLTKIQRTCQYSYHVSQPRYEPRTSDMRSGKLARPWQSAL